MALTRTQAKPSGPSSAARLARLVEECDDAMNAALGRASRLIAGRANLDDGTLALAERALAAVLALRDALPGEG